MSPHHPSPHHPSPDRELRILNEFAVSLLEQQSLEDLLWDMASNIGRLLGFEDCVIYLVEEGILTQVAAFGPKSPSRHEIVDPLRFPWTRGITGAAATTDEIQIVDDVRSDPRYVEDLIHGASELAVPVSFEGRCLVVLDAESSVRGFFDHEHARLLKSLGTIAAPRIAGAIAEQRRAEADRKLQRLNGEFEARVAARTAELRQALGSLRHETGERERLQEERADARRLESLGVLAGGLSHDFNNLLQSVAAHVSLARVDLAEDRDGASESLDAAERACLRARDLTQRIQTFARGGAPVKRPEQLCEVVKEAVESTLKGLPVDFEFECTPCPGQVPIDRSQITQVVRSLVLNGAEAMQGRDGVLGVFVRQSRLGGGGAGAEIVVKDQGTGIDESCRHRIFEPYFTTKEDGTGLGLAAAMGIVQRHGGELSVLETSNAGTTFRFVLPASADDDHAVRQSEQPTRDTRRVLLMDDNEMVRRATKSLLAASGFEVTACEDGGAATELIRQERHAGRSFDLALLDLTVAGGQGGLESLQDIRRIDPELPAVVISGYSDTPVLAQPDRYGFDGALRKPFGLEELRRAIGSVLGRSEGR